MSLWSYAVARFEVSNTGFDFDRVFKRSATWEELVGSLESDNKLWQEWATHPEDFMPSGSEGSLKRSLDGCTVKISGALRDFYAVEEVVCWFSKCCKDCHVIEASLHVENDCGTSYDVEFKNRYR